MIEENETIIDFAVVNNPVKMVEKKKVSKKMLKIKRIDNKVEDIKLIATVDAKLSTPTGTLEIKKGEDCGVYSASIICRLKSIGVI